MTHARVLFYRELYTDINSYYSSSKVIGIIGLKVLFILHTELGQYSDIWSYVHFW